MSKGAFATVILLMCSYASAQSYRQHPLFIYSFTRYIQWPEPSRQGDFVIFVLGDSPILVELQAMAKSKKIGERSIKVVKINLVSEIKKCNILFLPVDQSDLQGDVLKQVEGQPILVITEQSGLGVRGSCINFITKDGKLAFELNMAALTKQNLKASADLIRLAIMI